MGKHKAEKPADIVNIKPMNPKTGLIDASSIKEYRSAYSQYKAKHGNSEANPKMEDHITTRIHKTVDEQKKKRKRDITSVAMSTAAGTMVPFSGIPIMVASTVVQCVGFSASLGLIPIANVRSFQDANTLASQLTATLTKASTSGVKAAIEAFILEALKQAGLGYWLWEEILQDTVYELTSGVVTEAAWVITPLFVAPKYYLHRKLIKKMYVSLGEKAIVVHKAWVNDHLFLGKPETENSKADAYSAPLAAAAAAMASGAPVSHAGFPSAYPLGYPPHGQTQYESNSTNPQQHPAYNKPVTAYPPPSAQAQSQYPHYSTPYPTGQTNSSSGPQWYGFPQQYAPQQGSNDLAGNSYPANYSAPPPGAYNNQELSHMHTQSMPHLPSSQSGPNYSQGGTPPATYYPPQGQNGNGQNGHMYNNHPGSTAPFAQNYSQAPAGYPPQKNGHLHHLEHSHSAPPPGTGHGHGLPVVGGGFPMPYPSATQNPQQTMSYGPPPPGGNNGHYQHFPQAAPGCYPPQFPPSAPQQNLKQRQAEPC